MAYILDQIVKWLLSKASGLIGILNDLLASISIDLFKNELIQGFLSACQLGLNFVLVIGVVLWFFKILKLQEAGASQITEHVQALVAGVIFSRAVIPGVEWIYTVGMDVATRLGKLNINAELFSEDRLSGSLFSQIVSATGVGAIFNLIVVVVLIVEVFKVFKQQVKRFPVLLGHIPLAALYLPSIMSGNLENLWSWAKSCGGVMIAHIIQVLFLIIGFYLMTTTSIGNFVIGLGFVLTASKLDQIYGQWATTSQPSGYGGGVGRAAHAFLLFRR
ncbi:DUF6045 family protein [Erysipelotrichaceae bacterium OttesenSCG-928-M19]|nr:DUF6045 family protein [Erysipelotrichaceae bacterium OttesenSCG-928-M19]